MSAELAEKPSPNRFGTLLQHLGHMIVAPTAALKQLREQPVAWFPLLLLIGAWIVFWQWYFHAVDYAWLVDHMIAAETAKAPPDQHAAIQDGISKLKPGALVILSSLLTIVVLLLVTVLTSVYFVVVAAIVDVDLRFRHWFALSLWASVPSLFALGAMTLSFFLAAGGRIAPENLNPLSVYNLFGLPPGSRFASLLDSIDLTSLWTWALLVVGFRQWTGKGWAGSIVAVAIPLVAIYGTWAFLAWK